MDTRRSKNWTETPCCCLCGDVGFSDALLPCTQCTYRLQHTYCSRYYPERIEVEKWRCEWCVHEEEEQNDKRIQMIGCGVTEMVKEGKEERGKNRGSRAVDRWRKLAKAAKMGSAKRYKLLADVICSTQV